MALPAFNLRLLSVHTVLTVATNYYMAVREDEAGS